MGNVADISHDKKLDDWQDILQYNAVAGYCLYMLHFLPNLPGLVIYL